MIKIIKCSQEANLLIQQKTEVAGQKNQISLIREQLLAQKDDYQSQAELQTELIQRLNSDRLSLEATRTKTTSRNVIIPGTGVFAFPSDAPTSNCTKKKDKRSLLSVLRAFPLVSICILKSAAMVHPLTPQIICNLMLTKYKNYVILSGV